MLVHTVFFWLHKNLDGAELAEFRMGLESLKSIEHAKTVLIGTPAEVADRPVLIKNYDYCLTVILEDVAAHDAYQAHPEHLTFLANHKAKFERVCVYDAD
jgi:hypothetical protein